MFQFILEFVIFCLDLFFTKWFEIVSYKCVIWWWLCKSQRKWHTDATMHEWFCWFSSSSSNTCNLFLFCYVCFPGRKRSVFRSHQLPLWPTVSRLQESAIVIAASVGPKVSCNNWPRKNIDLLWIDRNAIFTVSL